MYNYHADLIFKIDIALLAAAIFFTVLTIIYTVIKEYRWRRRAGKLLNIKNSVYELALSGKNLDTNICLPLTFQITPQQFLDVTTNRIRDGVFFNEAEQKIFKQCFVSGKALARIENIALHSLSKWRRIEAILVLGYAENLSSLQIFKKSINSKDTDIAYFSIIALGRIRTVPSGKILLNFLKKKLIFQYKIFSVLESFPVEVAEEVIGLTNDANPEIRFWALKLISKLKPELHLKKIEEMTQDESEEVRAAACDCLGELAKPEAKSMLIRCLNDDFWLVRAHAVGALSKVLGKDCLEHIIARLNDPSLSVIDSVSAVIAEHIEAAMPFIENILHGNDVIAKRTCVQALEVSGYLLRLLQDILSETDNKRSHAVRVLEGMMKSAAHFGLEAALASFTQNEREKLLNIIRAIDKEMAGHIERSLAKEAD